MRFATVSLLIITITCGVSAAKQNDFDVCLKSIKSSMHRAMVTAENGLTKNWLEMVKGALETGADAIRNYEDCRKGISDALNWIVDNSTPDQFECLDGLQGLKGTLSSAVEDIWSGSSSHKILLDQQDVTKTLDMTIQRCIPN